MKNIKIKSIERKPAKIFAGFLSMDKTKETKETKKKQKK